MPKGVYIRTPEMKKNAWTPERRANQSAIMKIIMNQPEIKIKIRNSLNGKNRKPFTPEHLANMKIAQNRPEVIAKQVASHMGHEISEKTLNKITGPNSTHWRGGISKLPYAWTFNNELKEEVRRRDGYKCQLCDTSQSECNRALDVHHIDYDKTNSDPVNLIALCRGCNSRVNKNRNYWTEYFQTIIIRKIALI